MWLVILAYIERLLQWMSAVTKNAKHVARKFLGPEPINYYVLEDGRIIPTTISIPSQLTATTYMFDVQSNRMTLVADPTPTGRFRQLPIIGLVVEKSDWGISHDLTDWLSEIRINPVPSTKQLQSLQIIQLWGLLTNNFIPLNGTTVSTTDSSGETQQIVLE